MNDTLIYSVDVGNYDTSKRHCVVDNALTSLLGIPDTGSRFRNLGISREVKMRPDLHYKEYERYRYLVYLDASVEIKSKDYANFMKEYLDGHPVAFLDTFEKHKVTVYDEAKDCIRLGKASEDAVRAEIAKYIVGGLPFDHRLYGATSFIVDSKHEKAFPFLKQWHMNYSPYSRDQIALPYAIYKSGITVGLIPYKKWRSRVTLNEHNICK